MQLDAFLKLRDELRTTRPGLLDFSELNLYRSLASPAIAPSTHREAPYRCHFAEQYLSHLGLSQELKSRTQVSHGVRRSLKALFTLLARRNARIGIPSDVYPVYLQLAKEACPHPDPLPMGVTAWPSYEGLPSEEVLATFDALLICEPLKPWGTTLSERDAARLRSWARADERRMLIIDSAYATPPTARTLELLQDESAIVLVSLSKGWLIPDHGGLCITPHRFQRETREAFAALPKDEERLRVAYAALTEHADRPKEVARQLAALAARLDEFTGTRPQLRASKCTGYVAIAERSFTSLLEEGVLAVPASVFGAPEGTPRCVLSSLRR